MLNFEIIDAISNDEAVAYSTDELTISDEASLMLRHSNWRKSISVRCCDEIIMLIISPCKYSSFNEIWSKIIILNLDMTIDVRHDYNRTEMANVTFEMKSLSYQYSHARIINKTFHYY